MFQATRQIAAAFDEKDLKYTLDDGEKSSRLIAKFNGDNAKHISVRFISTDDDNDVAVRAFQIVTANADKADKVAKVVNELNNQFRYAKFIIDEDYDVNVEYDLPVRGQNVGPVCVEIFIRFMNIIDDAYPKLMQAIWS